MLKKIMNSFDENLSIVSEALVSCADEKLVTGRQGKPSALIIK